MGKQYLKALQYLHKLIHIFGQENVYLEIINTYLPKQIKSLMLWLSFSHATRIPLVATNNVHYLDKNHFPLYDLLVCTRTLTNLNDIHPERPLNAENYFASPEEMQNRFRQYPQALAATKEISQRCQASLVLNKNLFPKYPLPSDIASSKQLLNQLTWQGAINRYTKITPKIKERLKHELRIINQLDVADYFLVIWDIVKYANLKIFVTPVAVLPQILYGLLFRNYQRRRY